MRNGRQKKKQMEFLELKIYLKFNSHWMDLTALDTAEEKISKPEATTKTIQTEAQRKKA